MKKMKPIMQNGFDKNIIIMNKLQDSLNPFKMSISFAKISFYQLMPRGNHNIYFQIRVEERANAKKLVIQTMFLNSCL